MTHTLFVKIMRDDFAALHVWLDENCPGWFYNIGGNGPPDPVEFIRFRSAWEASRSRVRGCHCEECLTYVPFVVLETKHAVLVKLALHGKLEHEVSLYFNVVLDELDHAAIESVLELATFQ